jgi:hypothetical protein
VTDRGPIDAVALARAVPTGADAARLGEVLVAAGVTGDQLEASVRRDADGRLVGRRVMIEMAPPSLLEPLAAELAVSAGEAIDALRDAARSAGLPLILGWDGRSSGAVLKIYVNGSDASEPLRCRVRDRAGFEDATRLPAIPHIFALNVSTHGVERKAYLQRSDATSSAVDFGAAATRLARAALDRDLCAGAVECWDLALPPARRAWFVALRDGRSAEVDEVLSGLDGWSSTEVAEKLPFERGHCRSVGVPAIAQPAGWTAYFKARTHAAALWSLSPVASFGVAGDELCVYLAPARRAERAYARTDRWAVSFRTRQGRPTGPAAERLMKWVVRCIARADLRGVDPVAELADPPPPPWVRVE